MGTAQEIWKQEILRNPRNITKSKPIAKVCSSTEFELNPISGLSHAKIVRQIKSQKIVRVRRNLTKSLSGLESHMMSTYTWFERIPIIGLYAIQRSMNEKS